MIYMTKEKYINPYTDFGFKKLFEQAEIARYSDDERWQYEESKKVFWDNYSVMKTAVDNNSKEIARRMKARGYSIEDIAAVTDLSVDEIKNL